MVGNDIVDLNLASKESNWQRKGFLEKQFTKKEQREILAAENPFLKVWLFWSMKEAAYKCYTQNFEKRFFAPQKFECRLSSEDTGVVIFKELPFYTSSDLTTFYIHTTAEDIFIENNSEIRMYKGIGKPNFVAKHLKKRLEEKTGILTQEIVKRKTNIGAPQFYQKEKLLTKSCSISHHGNYGAYVFMLNEY